MVTSVVTEEFYSTQSCWCIHPDLSHSITAFRGRARCIYMVVAIGYLKLQGPSQTTWPPLELTDKIPTFPMSYKTHVLASASTQLWDTEELISATDTFIGGWERRVSDPTSLRPICNLTHFHENRLSLPL